MTLSWYYPGNQYLDVFCQENVSLVVLIPIIPDVTLTDFSGRLPGNQNECNFLLLIKEASSEQL